MSIFWNLFLALVPSLSGAVREGENREELVCTTAVTAEALPRNHGKVRHPSLFVEKFGLGFASSVHTTPVFVGVEGLLDL